MIATYNVKVITGIVFTLLLMITSYTAQAKEAIIKPVNNKVAKLLEGRELERDNHIGHIRSKMLVNSEEMALELAEVYVKNFYSEGAANRQKPYLVVDNETEWVVAGQYVCYRLSPAGGLFFIVISKKDGKVIFLTQDR